MNDGLFHFSDAKQLLTIQEVAAALGVVPEQVRKYLEEGLLFSVAINDKLNATRKHSRISRFSVVAFWRERALAENGSEPPFHQSPEVVWWRNQLRKSRKLPPLEVKNAG